MPDTPIRTTRRERLSGREALAFDVEGSVGGSSDIPEWLHIFPNPDPDGIARARDGRKFHFPSGGLAAVVEKTNRELEELGPGPVDLDHRLYSWFGGGGDASGWMTRVELRADGVWAKWEPLDEAAAKVREKTYRYTSSVLAVDREPIRDPEGWLIDFKYTATAIEGFGLTNIPAMRVKSFLSRSGGESDEKTAMHEETIKTVLSKLGLDEKADPAAIRAAFEKLADKGEPALSEFVPRADFDKLKAKLAAAEKAIADRDEAEAKAKREALLAKALDDGKILPSSKSYYERQLSKPGGIEDFEKFLADAPQLAAAKKAPPTEAASSDDDTPPPGISHEAWKLSREEKDPQKLAAKIRAARAANAKN